MTIPTERFEINGIPAVLYGRPSEKVYLFVHGMSGCKEEAEAFAEIVCPEYQVLAVDLPEHGERKTMRDAFNPWTVLPELRGVATYIKTRWSELSLRANSIGAYFSMHAFGGEKLRKALFVSPIIDMEKLICGMMTSARVSEAELKDRGEILTDFGQTLSWRYLSWMREHPIDNWRSPTAVLYAGQYNMTSRETADAFVTAHNAVLTVMENGKHWFHTPEQRAALAAFERENY